MELEENELEELLEDADIPDLAARREESDSDSEDEDEEEESDDEDEDPDERGDPVAEPTEPEQNSNYRSARGRSVREPQRLTMAQKAALRYVERNKHVMFTEPDHEQLQRFHNLAQATETFKRSESNDMEYDPCLAAIIAMQMIKCNRRMTTFPPSWLSESLILMTDPNFFVPTNTPKYQHNLLL
jgi:hypothetical protein